MIYRHQVGSLLLCVLLLCTLLTVSTVARGSNEPPEFAPLTVTLIKVDDGDSFAAYDTSGQRHRIRLAAIDAPERAQPHGSVAGKHLAQLLSNKPITVFRRKKDQYKRWIAKVVVEGADVGLLQVKAGNAWHYKRFAHEQPATERELFSQAQMAAQAERLGLWQAAGPLEPWRWRRNKRKKR